MICIRTRRARLILEAYTKSEITTDQCLQQNKQKVMSVCPREIINFCNYPCPLPDSIKQTSLGVTMPVHHQHLSSKDQSWRTWRGRATYVTDVLYCLFVLNKIIFFLFSFLCLIWHVIERNVWELSTVRRWASNSQYWWSYGTLIF